MVLRPDQERVRLMLKDTITLLCKNGLTFKKKFSIEAVIGVTLDEDDVFLISMNEIVKSTLDKAESTDVSNSDEETDQTKRRKRRKRPRVKTKGDRSDSSGAESVSDVHSTSRFEDSSSHSTSTVKRQNIKEEPQNGDDDGSGDLVFIKQEMDSSWLEPGLEGGHIETDTNFSGNFTSIQSTQDVGLLSDMTLIPVSSQDGGSGMWLPGGPNQQYPRRGRPPTVTTTLSMAGTSQSEPRDTEEGQPRQGEPAEGQPHTDQTGLLRQMQPSLRCNKTYNHKYILMQNRSSHDGTESGEFICSMCSKRFTLKSNWKRHERSHYGIFPYECKSCGKGFYGNERLRSHMASAHQSSTSYV